jgi:hypothetical protein
MTCAQLGGPCEHVHTGETADEIIHAQDQHLKDALASGDTTHQEAANAMKGRWRHPLKGMGWYKDVKKTFASLPEQ